MGTRNWGGTEGGFDVFKSVSELASFLILCLNLLLFPLRLNPLLLPPSSSYPYAVTKSVSSRNLLVKAYLGLCVCVCVCVFAEETRGMNHELGVQEKSWCVCMCVCVCRRDSWNESRTRGTRVILVCVCMCVCVCRRDSWNESRMALLTELDISTLRARMSHDAAIKDEAQP